MDPTARTLLLALLIGAAAGCSGPDPVDDPLPSAGDDTLIEKGVQTCADPAARDVQRFDRFTAADARAPGAFLHSSFLEGGGLLVEDLDGDGHIDVLFPGVTRVLLYWGRPGGAFEDGTAALDGLPLSNAVGATAVDYDADGDLDVFVTRWLQPDTLLRNDGGGLTDVTAAAFGSAPPALRSQSASWADVDADGDLDVFVGTYGVFTDLEVLQNSADCGDHVADPSVLWRNNGDGTFADASAALPPEVHQGYVFMSAWHDLTGDGTPELFTAHDDGRCGPSVLLHNVGGAFSVDTTTEYSSDNRHDMGMGVADLNGDALPDFLLTSWNGTTLLQSTQTPDGLAYIDWSASLGLEPNAIDFEGGQSPGEALPGMQIYGWGADLGDLDNDADLDAVMLYGYWSTYDGPGDPLQQDDGLWRNDNGAFTDVAADWGVADNGVSRGLVLADLNADGFLDIVKRDLAGDSPVHLSRCGAAAWLTVRLSAPGANTHGIGATVKVTTGGTTQVRWIHSGSSAMYSGAPLQAHIGLGDVDRVDRLEVVWPDGAISRFDDVAARQAVTVVRSAAPQ